MSLRSLLILVVLPVFAARAANVTDIPSLDPGTPSKLFVKEEFTPLNERLLSPKGAA
jgi:hypothetical protein